MKRPTGTAVIGIGNEFRRDDGVGWAVVSLLRDRAAQGPLPSDTLLAQCDGDPGRLITLWENTGLTVLVDACFPPSAVPGRVHRWCAASGDDLGAATPGRHSTHGLGPAEALRLAEALGRAPGHLIVYAVEGADRSLGTGLTPAVACAVPRLARQVEADVEQYSEARARGLGAG
ncbi:peptidase M52 [Streptomyces venezuelae]|uniref:Peptidase M52 n=1 Tax=Streptomyces venezuelae TaxID=54571 RepID=A0A5P2CVW2_STRVZ|nr:hydrogenase maturation protease [Streptomyces venezuelae]QES47044.1 peptidase M52 [Streptomyces venezuelae]